MAHQESARIQVSEQTSMESRYMADIVEVPGQDETVRSLVDDLFKSADAGVFSAMHKICEASKADPTAEQL